MDSITHIALGAIVGEALLGKKLGKKAMLIGAAAQSLPDIDFVTSFWLSPVEDLLSHRGFTHSILFAILASFLLGFAAVKLIRASGMTAKEWILFFGLEIAIHLALDSLNCYGTGLFEPFSHTRISFNVLYVADPFYSLWLGVGFSALLILKRHSPSRKNWTRLSLLLSTTYLCYTLINKVTIDKEAKSVLSHQGISDAQYFTTPTPLNNWLWFVVAAADSGYYVGYGSVFDWHDSIAFSYFPQRASLLKMVENENEVSKLIRFSKGFYTVEKRNDTLLFNDLRFGQIAGWANPRAKFSFHYDLHHPEANLFVVQQGRFSSWNRKTITAMFRRIRGY